MKSARSVMIVGSFWRGSLEESYAQAFEALGWTALRFDWERRAEAHALARWGISERVLRNAISDRVGRDFINELKQVNPAFLLVIKGRTISREVIERARETMSGRPVANFNPDSPWERRNSSARILDTISAYDVHFTWSRALLSCFETAGSPQVAYLPFAYDPSLHYPTERVEPVLYDAVFVGTYDPDRDKLLAGLRGCRIGIWGNGWKRATHVPKEWIRTEAVYGEEATKALNSGTCALNILRPQNAGSHNMRTFEIPATRNLMIASRSEEQCRFFEEGQEMLCYSSVDELRELILKMSHSPEIAQKFALNGYERVRGETYAARALSMLEVLGLANDAR